MIPNKTLATRLEKGAQGMKKQKECITLMACSNATGSHKLPLVFINKAAVLEHGQNFFTCYILFKEECLD